MKMSHLNKKYIKNKTGDNSIDFHLEIVNKIDKLLQNNENNTINQDTINDEQIYSNQKDFPVEIRSPLSKRIISPEANFSEKPIGLFNREEDVVEKAKIDLPKDHRDLRTEENSHIEIIDLGSDSIKKINSENRKVV